MLKRTLLVLLIAFLLAVPSFGQLRPFSELWNHLSYYDTNLERKGFGSILGRFEGKFGVGLFNMPLQVYGLYYAAGSQDSSYWNNYLYSGAGVRYRPFSGYRSSGWHDEWVPNLKIFAESLSSSYFKDAASAESSGLSTSDVRFGFDLWQEWNLENPSENYLWGELWSNLSYRTTNFGWETFENYIFYYQQKIGRHLGRGIEVYVRGDVVVSGKEGASYYFLNKADYGAGIRFEPWRRWSTADNLFRKFKMFIEVLGLTYLKDQPANPVTSDVRFGVDFSYGR